MIEIARHFSPGAVVTANSSAATTSGMFPIGRFGSGCVMIANTNGATQISWFGTVSPSVPPQRIYASGFGVTTALTVGIHPIPESCMSVNYLVPVIAGGSTCAMTVMAKG
jgi:hypothetical protein